MQVKDVQGVRADVASGVSDADGASVQDPETTAFVSFDAVDGVQADFAVLGGVGGPVGVGDEFGGATGRPRQVNVV